MFVDNYIKMSKAVIVKADKNNIILRQPGETRESQRMVKISKLGVVSIYYSSGWFKKFEGNSWGAIDEYLCHQYTSKRCTLNPNNNTENKPTINKMLQSGLEYNLEHLKKEPTNSWWRKYGEANAIKDMERLEKVNALLDLPEIPMDEAKDIISNFTRNLNMQRLVGNKSQVAEMVKKLQ